MSLYSRIMMVYPVVKKVEVLRVKNRSVVWGEGLMAAVIVARSTSFLMSKTALQEVTPFSLLAVRFSIAFFILALLFWKRLVRLEPVTVLRGALLGGAFFSVMVVETIGLTQADSSTVALLENTAIVIVPLLQAVLLRRMPRVAALASACCAFVGIALLTMGESGLSWQGGEGFSLLAALLYACAIILTDHVSRQDDPLVLGILQVGFMGLFSIVAACLTGGVQMPISGSTWAGILWLSIVCSVFGFTLQPVAQRRTTAERAAMFCALSPLSASVLGAVFLHEQFGSLDLIGAALILIGIFLAGQKRSN